MKNHIGKSEVYQVSLYFSLEDMKKISKGRIVASHRHLNGGAVVGAEQKTHSSGLFREMGEEMCGGEKHSSSIYKTGER